MKKMKITLLFLTLFTICSAPEWKALTIVRTKGTNPHEKLWKAVCFVESTNNPLAYHWEKNGCVSVGIAQIQQSRVKDYNERTGSNYTLFDMYNPIIAKEVFMHYASDYKPWEMERVAREWNAGPNGMKYKQTLTYWKKVQLVLK